MFSILIVIELTTENLTPTTRSSAQIDDLFDTYDEIECGGEGRSHTIEDIEFFVDLEQFEC